MTPSEERSLGEQLGRVEQGIVDLKGRFSSLEATLERRLYEQEQQLRKIDSEKVPWAWATAHEKHAEDRNKQIDRLDSRWDFVRGALAFISFALAALAALAVLLPH